MQISPATMQALERDPSFEMIAFAFKDKTFGEDMIVEKGWLYDTVRIASGAAINETSTKGFVNVIGKTQGETNLRKQRELDAPQMFSLFNIGVYISSGITRADADALANDFALRVNIAGYPKFLAPLICFPAAGGIFGFINGAASAERMFSNGFPTQESRQTLDPPCLIESGVTFETDLVGTAFNATGAFVIKYIFTGLHARPTVG